jgi:Peptidase family S41
MRWAIVAVLALVLCGAAWAQGAPGKPQAPAPDSVDIEAAEPVDARSPEEWQAITLENLNAMRDALIAHTPIGIPGGDPHQQAWLEAGYQEALALIPRVHDELGLLYVLRLYAIGFDDIHLSVNQGGPPNVTLWPGFVAARRGQDTIVYWRPEEPAEGQPPEGALIESCDGQSITALVDAGLFRFWRAPGVSRGYLQATSRLFIDNASGFFPPPQQCVMQWGGMRRDVPLIWSEVDLTEDTMDQKLQEADGRTQAEWGLNTPAPGITWIGVPSFLDYASSEIPLELTDIIYELTRRRDRLRRDNVIVIDLRGNGGGLLGGAHDLAEALFGPQAGRRSRGLFMRTSSVFRISQGNVDFISERTNRAGAPAQTTEDYSPFGWMFLGALRNGEASLTLGPRTERPVDVLTAQRQSTPPAPASDGARVYILMNETCLSACLAFLDTAAFMPGVTLVGGITGEDGPLTWPRQVALPGPDMWLSVPMVEWRGPARGAGEAYQPDFVYTGVWEDEAVRAWVLDLIAQGATANR